MLALVDANSFYASCESALRPDLKGKPVVVLSDNDGCVIISNAETKALGINMGASYFEQKALLKRCGVFYFSLNYKLYMDMSSRVMPILEELSPHVETYGIDEALCDLTGARNCRDLTGFGRETRETILQKIRLMVEVGIAQTKTLVKLANHAAKKWQRQTGGVVDLSNIERRRRLVVILPVDEVWGAERCISKKLGAMGIKTVCGLADIDIRFVRKHFDVVLERTMREPCGEPCLVLEEFMPVKQEIIYPRSSGKKLTGYNAMRETIYTCTARAAEKLRREHQLCRFISIFIRASPFSLNEPCYGDSASIKLLTPTQDNREIIRAATCNLDAIWREGLRYQKTGVMPSDSFNPGVAQLSLFGGSAPWHNSDKLMAVLDTPNAGKGKGTLYFAG